MNNRYKVLEFMEEGKWYSNKELDQQMKEKGIKFGLRMRDNSTKLEKEEKITRIGLQNENGKFVFKFKKVERKSGRKIQVF